MPSSHQLVQQFVSHSRGQKRIDLRAALEASPLPESRELTFGELARAYLAAHYDGAEMQLRKWIDAFEDRSAWSISSTELAQAGAALLSSGFSGATVNRNLSQIGSIYKWAKSRMLTPPGFVSPTISQYRYPEPIRRVELSDKEVQRLIDGSAAFKDRRFSVLIRLLVETGARRGEVSERRWADVDLVTSPQFSGHR